MLAIIIGGVTWQSHFVDSAATDSVAGRLGEGKQAVQQLVSPPLTGGD